GGAVLWRPVIVGLVLTFALAVLMLKIAQTEVAFGWVNRAVGAVAAATRAGTSFVFGYVGGRCATVRSEEPGLGLHSRISGAASRAGDERAVVPALLLAHPAADRARLLMRRCSFGPISISCRAAKCSS